MIICTTASLARLPHALELARSVRTYHPEAKFVLGLIEEWVPESVKQSPWFDQVVQIKDIGIPDFRSFIFKLSALQALRAVQGSFMAYVLSHDTHADKVIFLEHTMKLYGPLREAVTALSDQSIVLIPHLSEPNYTSSYEHELKLLHVGSFSGGFVGVRRSEESESFLTWWVDRILDSQGSHVQEDHKWLDLVPVHFNPIILRHPGYQLACWNLLEPSRQLSMLETDGVALVSGALRCVNFRDEHNEFDESLYSLTALQAELAHKLRQQYNAAVHEHEVYGFYEDTIWSYDYYYNGKRVTQAARNAYRDNENKQLFADPYAWSNNHITSGIQRSKASSATANN